ncbi:MAG: DUF1697 domain-containing protein [Eubacteriales bacterium]|nr:DUF1697 domain-containing protein [Eubacteriales bacterium]
MPAPLLLGNHDPLYLAFLRGINRNGKNVVPMAALKQGFDLLGFSEVKTFLNSDNVAFSSDEKELSSLRSLIEESIQNQFGLDVPVFVIAQEELADILRHAPSWWGSESKEIYDNLILILPPTSLDEVLRELGEPKEGLEKVMGCQKAIFWSFSRKDYQRTNWWSRTAASGVGGRLTIRTATTVRKLAQG